MLILFISILALIIGPVLSYFIGKNRLGIIIIDTITIIAVAILVIFHILPENIKIIGFQVMIPMLIGLLGPTLTEYWFGKKLYSTTHNIILLFFIGHALLDGMVLASFKSSHPHGDAFSLAIILHRIPMGLVLWKILSTQYHIKIAITIFLGIICSTFLGYFFFSHIEFNSHPYLDMFIAGTLLHIVIHHNH